jgi:hypothetical protein
MAGSRRRIPNMTLVMQFAADQIGARLAIYYHYYHFAVRGRILSRQSASAGPGDAISDPFREAATLAGDRVPDDNLPVSRAAR